jgi:hypothetical protein
MTLFMETTQVEDAKTVAEIQALLARQGASSVSVEYSNGNVDSVCFRLKVGDASIPFRLPCRYKAVENLLKKSGKKVRRNDSIERWARRVAWRQILRWVEAQLALIETGMVKPQEVFLSYAIVNSGKGEQTMFEMISERNFLAIESKPEP